MDQYFERIQEKTDKAYKIAKKARSEKKDPEDDVDIPLAEDLPEKSERLITASMFPQLEGEGVKERIREIEEEYGKNDMRVALSIGKEVAQERFYDFESQEDAVGAGLRIGLAYLTGGIVTAPLEGIADVTIRENDDGSSYLAVYYAGPIRSAGGTASAVSVLLADYIRKEVGLEKYKPRDDEIERYATEVEDYYTRVTKKQYTPTREEVRMISNNVPIEITGSPTENIEVSNYKDLSRIDTNRIRGGMCLVYLDGLPLKASKLVKRIKKYGSEFGLEHWNWLEDYLKLQKETHSSSSSDSDDDSDEQYVPSSKFLGNIVAGRPVFSFPGEKGGFRLRYGRTRTSGLAGTSFHPASMEIVDGFLGIGTQLKTEYPGKATVSTPCDSIEPPIVKLKNGDVVRVETAEEARELVDNVKNVVFLGDILVSYGEFLENGKSLLPSGYVEEWWALEVKEKIKDSNQYDLEDLKPYLKKDPKIPTPEKAFELSENLDLPLHPHYLYLWRYLSYDNFLDFYQELFQKNQGRLDQDHLIVDKDSKAKSVLEELWITHKVDENKVEIDKKPSKVLKKLLKLDEDNLDYLKGKNDVVNAIEDLSGFEIKEKAPNFLGARMGRPEKAERRVLKGKPQVLFPCGDEGGRYRNLIAAYEKETIENDVINYYCRNCNKTTPFPFCPDCGESTESIKICPKCGKKTSEDTHCGKETTRNSQREINVKELVDKAKENIGMSELPELLKAPRGIISKHKHVEPIEKGLLREKYNLYVNKDGTTRYDSSDLTLTHFKPKEIGVSVDKLKELGYKEDIEGNELESKDQVLLLKPQDIIISENEQDYSAVKYMKDSARFVDELLEEFYGIGSYYDIESRDDLLGELVIGLAPHTSGGIIGRIIGFNKAKGTYAHPYWHAGKRRNCDGDEDSIMLLMDSLLNFSRKFLPDRRGSRSMDAPLILASILSPDEVDDESWNVDVEGRYPLEFYQATQQYKEPWEVEIKTAEDLIEQGDPFESNYTHPVSNINKGPFESAYVTLGDMSEKVSTQLTLGEEIKAVDHDKVAELLLTKHFIKDIKGNLRKFSYQTFRCVDCNEKYRRIPLKGICKKCGGDLLLTVSEGSIRKYLIPSEQIIEKYDISPYVKQQVFILKKRIQSMFGKEDRQSSLGQFTD